MVNILKNWYKKYFSHPEAVWLLLFLLLSTGLIVHMGEILAPIITSLVFVYLIEWLVQKITKFGMPARFAYLIVYLLFLAAFIATIMLLLLLWRQLSNLFADLPSMLQNAKRAVIEFIEQYPNYLPKEQIDLLASRILLDAQNWAKNQVSSSFSYISGIVSWLIYLLLIPLLVFFFLKDRIIITKWFTRFLPKNHKVLKTIWSQMDQQLGNYLRGKILQIGISSIFNSMVFLYFQLNYAILLGVLVGLSCIIPYVGGIIVAIPLVLVGYLQWGFNLQLCYILVVFLIVQGLDANVLVPILFSKAVNLHPIAIVIAILLFGSIWGFWGIVFAIPLATLVKTLLSVWPVAN